MKKIRKFTEEEKKYIIEHYPYEQTQVLADKLGITKKQLRGFAYYHHLKKSKDFIVIRKDNALTYDQIEQIIEMFPDHTNAEIVEKVGCTRSLIGEIARRRKLIKKVEFSGNGNISPENKRFILDNYSIMQTSEISKITGVSEENIRSYANLHNIKKNEDYIMFCNNFNGLTLEQKQYILNNFSDKTTQEISNKLGVDNEKIRNYASNRKLTKTIEGKRMVKGYIDELLKNREHDSVSAFDVLGKQKENKINEEDLFLSKYGKYKVNQNYFEKIDSEWKAYWLGFLYADGSVISTDKSGKNKNVVKIALKSSDKKHLEKFRESIQTTVPIKIRKTNMGTDSCLIAICNKKLTNDLIKCGCIPKKSLVLTFPNEEILPYELIRHFIRGYFDGDGCICINIEKRIISFSILGTQDMLKHIEEFFRKAINTNKVNIIRHCNENVYSLQYRNMYDIEKIYRLLYKNSNIFLDRKLEKFDTIYSLK